MREGRGVEGLVGGGEGYKKEGIRGVVRRNSIEE